MELYKTSPLVDRARIFGFYFRPFLVRQILFSNSNSMFRSSDGRLLFIASLEGSIGVIALPDIGRKLSDSEFKERMKSTYGEEYLQGKTLLLEDPALLLLSKVSYLSQGGG